MNPTSVDASSPRLGWWGLAGITAGMIAAFLLIAEHLDDWLPAPTPWLRMAVIGIVCAPLVSVYSCWAFFPMFMPGTLWLRFAKAMVAVLIAFFGFVAATSMTTRLRLSSDDRMEIGTMILAFVLGVSLVSVLVQLWSRQAIVTEASQSEAIKSVSISDLMQLMAITAVMMAIWRLLTPRPSMFTTLVTAVVMGVACGVLLVPLVLGYLSTPRRPRLLSIGTALAMATSFGWAISMAKFSLSFNPLGSMYDAGLVCVISIGSAASYLAVTLGCVAWLRRCGWTIRTAKT